MNFVRVLRNVIGVGLFVAFIVCAVIALKDLTDRKIGTSVRYQERQKISLPSWTLCPYDHVPSNVLRNASTVHDLSAVLKNMPITFKVAFTSVGWSSDNMTDENVLKEKYNVTMEETWNVQCKVNVIGTGCDTCLTFNAPAQKVEKFIAILKIPEFHGKESMTLQLHDPGHSLALNREYEWNQILYFVFKKGKT